MKPSSPKWRLNALDMKKWGKNTLTFLAPVGIIYLGSVTPLLQDGASLSDFAISPMVAGAMILYVINVLLDVFRKLASNPK